LDIRSSVIVNFEQSGCELKGELVIEPPLDDSVLQLFGSGPLVGTIDGDTVTFTVAGDTNDAGATLEFEGTVVYPGLLGTYSNPIIGHLGIWEVTYAPFAPTPTATPTPISTGTGFGPTDGTIVHDPNDGFIPAFDSATSLTNVVVEANLDTPFAFTARRWSSGFLLRQSGPNALHSVVIDSGGMWSHNIRTGTFESSTQLQVQFSRHIATARDTTNHVRVVVLDEKGWLFINGNYVGELDMSGHLQAGTVKVIGSWFKGDEIPGQSTSFRGFTVRPLERAVDSVDGKIAHDPDSGNIQSYSGNVELKDAVIQVRFFNPYAVSEGPWSSGIGLRNSTYSAFHAILIHSDGLWYHRLRTGSSEGQKLVQERVSDDISTSPAGSNQLRIIALGDDGWLFINGSYIEKLDLSGWDKKGEVYAVGSYFSGHGIAGKSTRFQDFTVWSVGLNE